MGEAYYDLRISRMPLVEAGDGVFEVEGKLALCGLWYRLPTQDELRRAQGSGERPFLEVRDNGTYGGGVQLVVGADLGRGHDDAADDVITILLSLECTKLLHAALGAIIALRTVEQSSHSSPPSADRAEN